jgi:hypothetical protein
MKELLKKLSELQLDLAEANASYRSKVAELEQKITTLIPLANYGAEYHKHLVSDYIKYKTTVGELEIAHQEQVKKMAEGWSISFLRDEVTLLLRRVSEKSLKSLKRNPLTPVTESQMLKSRSTSRGDLLRPKQKNV